MPPPEGGLVAADGAVIYNHLPASVDASAIGGLVTVDGTVSHLHCTKIIIYAALQIAADGAAGHMRKATAMIYAAPRIAADGAGVYIHRYYTKSVPAAQDAAAAIATDSAAFHIKFPERCKEILCDASTQVATESTVSHAGYYCPRITRTNEDTIAPIAADGTINYINIKSRWIISPSSIQGGDRDAIASAAGNRHAC